MKELMKELAQKYIEPIPLLIMALCVYTGYITALEPGALPKNFIVTIFVGIMGGVIFVHGYVEKKYRIFLWALIGICIASATAVLEGENRVLITNLFLEAVWGAFVGLLIEPSPRGVAIGALALGLLIGSLAMWGGVVNANGIKMENQTLAVIQVSILYAWKGALYGGMFGASFSEYKKGKRKTKSEPA